MAKQLNAWLGGAVVKASDLWSIGCEFDFRPCTAGLVLRWVTVLYVGKPSRFWREAGSLSLADRREGLSFKFFKKTIRPDSCIHHLIPEKWDESTLSRIRNPSQYSILLALERFKRSLFYMLCAVFRPIFLKIFVMILFLTLSAICVFYFILNFI